MKKILHVFKTYFPDAPGGVQEAIRAISRYTRDYGFQHSVFTLSPHPVPLEIDFEGALVHREKQVAAPLSCPIGNWRSIRELRRMAENADIILYHYPWPFGDLMSLGIKDKPSIVLYHSDIIKQRYTNILYAPLRDFFLERSAVIVATSPNYAESSVVLQKYRSKLRMIPLTSIPEEETEDDKIIKELKLARKPFVLFVGVLRYYKGLDTLIKAAKNVDCCFIIAGEGPERAYLESARIDLRNDYAVSKYAAELVLALFKNDFEITIVRPFNYTGRGQAQTFLIPKIVEAFRNKQPELELGNLNVSRDFSDVRDVASVYARLVDLPSNFDIINICSGRAYSIGQIVKICSSLTHHDVHIKTNPHFVRKNDILKQCGDADLLNAKMGVNFKRRMLSETLHWMIFP